MDAAFLVGLGLPPPAAGAFVLAGEDGACAGGAADRREAVVEELVVRDLVLVDVGPHAVEGPVGERVELHDAAVILVDLDLRDVPAAPPLLAPKAGHPRVERRELALQRFHLADLAAREPEVDPAIHQVRAVLLHEAFDLEPVGELELDLDAVAVADLLEQRVGLGRQAAGVEREHADRRVDPPGHVDEHHPVDTAGGADRHLRVEPFEGPREELLRARILEPFGGLVHPRRLLVNDG